MCRSAIIVSHPLRRRLWSSVVAIFNQNWLWRRRSQVRVQRKQQLVVLVSHAIEIDLEVLQVLTLFNNISFVIASRRTDVLLNPCRSQMFVELVIMRQLVNDPLIKVKEFLPLNQNTRLDVRGNGVATRRADGHVDHYASVMRCTHLLADVVSAGAAEDHGGKEGEEKGEHGVCECAQRSEVQFPPPLPCFGAGNCTSPR